MLLDYVTREDQPREDGVRVAGLLDLVALAKALGRSVDDAAVSGIMKHTAAAPEEAYRDSRTFFDPVGRLMVDTGPTYAGRPLRSYKSIDSLRDRGQTLRDYLDGTEMGEALAPQLGDIRVGKTDIGRYGGGFTPPNSDGPGFLVISSGVDRGLTPQLFEHEMQHVYQSILGMPRGTNLDEMSGPMMEYLTEIGSLSPAQLARIDAKAPASGVPKAMARYYSSLGEAEARAAQMRGAWVHDGGVSPADLRPPELDQYQWTPDNYTVGANDFFSIPQDAGDGFSEWWKRKGGK